jgi:CubicO group peptidase (beta-lactamase class C family)
LHLRLGIGAAALIAASAAVSTPAGAIPASNTAIAGQVDALMSDAARQGFGGAVVIEREGRVLLSKGHGLANRRARTPFSDQTVAPIGSITKNFTALALLQLAAQGKVDLQATVRTYLTNTREPAASARLSDILVHHAGLAEYCGDDFTRRTKRELITICTALPLEFTPGKWAYSNLGYSLLAAIVEQVSRQSWEDYLREHVFAPAGMTRSGWLFSDRRSMQFAEGNLDDKPRGIEADRTASFWPISCGCHSSRLSCTLSGTTVKTASPRYCAPFLMQSRRPSARGLSPDMLGVCRAAPPSGK